jgi:hypothetical protein
MHPPAGDRQRLLDALAQIDAKLADNIERSLEIRRRVAWVHGQVVDGAEVRAVIEAEPAPRIVELLTANMTVIETAGADLRTSLAHSLRSEGLTIESIAALFGVTRQRASALLKQGDQSSHVDDARRRRAG